jgi:hypothetical protein
MRAVGQLIVLLLVRFTGAYQQHCWVLARDDGGVYGAHPPAAIGI